MSDAITLQTYDEAIRNLTDARGQIASGELWLGCGYCGSDEHSPNFCDHNPLVLAERFRAQRCEEYWRCFHCGEVFSLGQAIEAREHFGVVAHDGRDDPYSPAACLAAEAKATLGYVAVASCGCIRGALTARAAKSDGAVDIAAWIRAGLSLERMPIRDLRWNCGREVCPFRDADSDGGDETATQDGEA